MSKFNKYAQQVNEVVNEAFTEFKKVESRYIEAEKQVKLYPDRFGFVNEDYAIKNAKAKANFIECKKDYDQALQNLENSRNKINSIKDDLRKAIRKEYAANPEDINEKTLELLKSGILSYQEYKTMLDDEIRDNNATMVRLIGKYALEAAEKNQDREDAKGLRVLAESTKGYTGAEHLTNFENIEAACNHLYNNHALYEKWDDLTTNMIENF